MPQADYQAMRAQALARLTNDDPRRIELGMMGAGAIRLFTVREARRLGCQP
jgi:hypothetical protein